MNSNTWLANTEKIVLGGWEQWILTGKENRDKPVLLFLHGGPGFPIIPFAQAFNNRLLEYFNLVLWDQRGAGKSYDDSMAAASLSMEHLIGDTHELTSHLQKRFHQDKIYLAGHSLGAVLALEAVKRFPGDYQAVLPVAPVVNIQRSVTFIKEFIRQSAEQAGSLEKIKTLLDHPYTNRAAEFYGLHRLVEQFGGALYGQTNTGLLNRIISASLHYSVKEKAEVMEGLVFCVEVMWPEFARINLFSQIPQIKVPCFFLLGAHDYLCPTELSREYYEFLSAPLKKLFIFKKSAHFPFFEQPHIFTRDLGQILHSAEQKIGVG